MFLCDIKLEASVCIHIIFLNSSDSPQRDPDILWEICLRPGTLHFNIILWLYIPQLQIIRTTSGNIIFLKNLIFFNIPVIFLKTWKLNVHISFIAIDMLYTYGLKPCLPFFVHKYVSEDFLKRVHWKRQECNVAKFSILWMLSVILHVTLVVFYYWLVLHFNKVMLLN